MGQKAGSFSTQAPVSQGTKVPSRGIQARCALFFKCAGPGRRQADA